jgi:hypothetical protein
MYRLDLTTVKRHRGEPGLLPPANTPPGHTYGTHGTHLGQSDTRITHRRNLTTNQPSLRPSQLSRPTNAHTHSRATNPEPTEPAEPTEPRGRLRRDNPGKPDPAHDPAALEHAAVGLLPLSGLTRRRSPRRRRHTCHTLQAPLSAALSLRHDLTLVDLMTFDDFIYFSGRNACRGRR